MDNKTSPGKLIWNAIIFGILACFVCPPVGVIVLVVLVGTAIRLALPPSQAEIQRDEKYAMESKRIDEEHARVMEQIAADEHARLADKFLRTRV